METKQDRQAALDLFFETIKPIPSKDCGGCLIFCYAFFLFLHRNKLSTKSFKIIQYDYNGRAWTRSNLRFIYGGRNRPQSSYHFTFVYDGVEYDCEGRFDKNRVSSLERTILPFPDRKALVRFCVNSIKYSNWNWTFRREKWMPIVNKYLGISMTCAL